MEAHVAARLLALNREFYQTFSADFAQTRERLQPGMARPPLPPGPLPLGSAVRFDWAFLFAVLHHLPGSELRLRVCQEAHRVLVPGGRLALSNWQFTRSERLPP